MLKRFNPCLTYRNINVTLQALKSFDLENDHKYLDNEKVFHVLAAISRGGRELDRKGQGVHLARLADDEVL